MGYMRFPKHDVLSNQSPRRQHARCGFTVVELLVVMAVIGLLVGLLLPAVQQTRSSARRIDCANKLRQLGLAIHNFESVHKHFPSGKTDLREHPLRGEMSWHVPLLPFLEQTALWGQSTAAFAVNPYPYSNPPHSPLGKAVAAFGCPEDSRVEQPQSASSLGGAYAGLTSYLGVSGIDYRVQNGVFHFGSAVRFADIKDGSSNTLAIGERPPSPDFNFGWWYTGAGQNGTGNADMFLGVEERIAGLSSQFAGRGCPDVSQFSTGNSDKFCDALHFWSLHPGGAHFVLADGSVRFMSYSSSAAILKSMATRSGGEVN